MIGSVWTDHASENEGVIAGLIMQHRPGIAYIKSLEAIVLNAMKYTEANVVAGEAGIVQS